MKKLLLFVLLISLCFSFCACGDAPAEQISTQQDAPQRTPQSTPESTPQNTPIQYKKLVYQDLALDMNENPARAQAKYIGQYYYYTAKASVSSANEIILDGLFCHIEGEELEQKVLNLNNGDTVTVKGKITSIKYEGMFETYFVHMDTYEIVK